MSLLAGPVIEYDAEGVRAIGIKPFILYSLLVHERRYANVKGLFPLKDEYLAEITGFSVSQIRSARKVLLSRGLITVKRQFNEEHIPLLHYGLPYFERKNNGRAKKTL